MAASVMFFETRASCFSAPMHGPANAVDATLVINSNNGPNRAILMPSFLGDLQDLIGFNISQDLHCSARPSQLDLLDGRVRAEPEVDPRIRRTGIASRSRDMVVLHQSGFTRQFDPGTDSIAIALDSDRLNQNPVVSAGRGVVKQLRGTANG